MFNIGVLSNQQVCKNFPPATCRFFFRLFGAIYGGSAGICYDPGKLIKTGPPVLSLATLSALVFRLHIYNIQHLDVDRWRASVKHALVNLNLVHRAPFNY